LINSKHIYNFALGRELSGQIWCAGLAAHTERVCRPKRPEVSYRVWCWIKNHQLKCSGSCQNSI